MLLKSGTSSPAAITPPPKPTAQASPSILSEDKPIKPAAACKSTLAGGGPARELKTPALPPAPACTQLKASTARVQQVNPNTTIAALQDIVRRLSKENDHLKGRLHNASCPTADSSTTPSKEDGVSAPPRNSLFQAHPVIAEAPANIKHVPGHALETVVTTPRVSDVTTKQPTVTISEPSPTHEVTLPEPTCNQATISQSDNPPSTCAAQAVTTSTHRNERMQLGRLITSGKITADTHPQVLELWNGSLKDLCSYSSRLLQCCLYFQSFTLLPTNLIVLLSLIFTKL